VIVEPPSYGASQVSVTCLFVGTAETLVGASGTVAGVAVGSSNAVPRPTVFSA